SRKLPQGSATGSSRQRVTASPRQRTKPAPLPPSMVVSRPLPSRCRGVAPARKRGGCEGMVRADSCGCRDARAAPRGRPAYGDGAVMPRESGALHIVHASIGACLETCEELLLLPSL